MSISLCISAKFRVEPESGYRAVRAFLSGDEACPTLDTLDQEPGTRLFRKAAFVFTLRRVSGGPEGNEILAAIGAFEAGALSAREPPNAPEGVSVFVLDAFKVAPELRGFAPNVADRLLATAVTWLAIGGDTDREGSATSTCVLMFSRPGDERMMARLQRLGAAQLANAPDWIADMVLRDLQSDHLRTSDVWWISPACALQCARIVLDRPLTVEARRSDPNPNMSRHLIVQAERTWLQSAQPILEEVAEGTFDLGWVPPPSTKPLMISGGRSQADPGQPSRRREEKLP
jgi:hypothetical protein